MNENKRDFLTVLKNRKEYLNCLWKLSLSQNRIIEENNYDELLSVLQKKQNIIRRMEEFRQRDLDLKKEWESVKSQLESQSKQDCENVIEDSRRILEEIISSKKESTEFLMKRREETQLQLKAVQQGDQAHRAYLQHERTSRSRIIDIGQ